jgi:hypothetical protein
MSVPLSALYTVTELRMTCSFCPTHWEGKLATGESVYIRYRRGWLTMYVGFDLVGHTTAGKKVYSKPVGNNYDAEMDLEELREHLRYVAVLPEDDGP